MPLEDRADPEAGRKLLSPRRNGKGPPPVQHAVDDEEDDYSGGYQAPDTRQGSLTLGCEKDGMADQGPGPSGWALRPADAIFLHAR